MVSESKETETEENEMLTLSREEKVIQYLLTTALPLIITGIAFGVIILAFAGWKLY